MCATQEVPTDDRVAHKPILWQAAGSQCIALPQHETTADPDDQAFCDLAMSNNAVLVTGSTRHFPDSEAVMTPARFLEHVRKGA